MIYYNRLDASTMCNGCQKIKEDAILTTLPTLTHQVIFILCDECLEKMLIASKPPETLFKIEWGNKISSESKMIPNEWWPKS